MPKVKYKKNGDWNDLDFSSGGSGSASIDDTNTSVDKTWSSDKINKQFQTIANEDLVIGEDGKLHIKQGDGTEKGTGVEIPSSTELPSNVVTYEEETETDEDIVTAQNIKLVDTSNNFEATDVEGALSELFQSASNGKSKIATAITGKGVNTSASDTFEQMATNIGQISTGSTGITPTGSIDITENGTYDVTNYASAIVNVASQGVESGSFTPSENTLTQTLVTSRQCSNVVVIKSSDTLTNIGARQIASYVQIGTKGRGLATNSSGNSWAGAIVKNSVSYATFGATSITLQFELAGGSGYMVAGEQYDWFAW